MQHYRKWLNPGLFLHMPIGSECNGSTATAWAVAEDVAIATVFFCAMNTALSKTAHWKTSLGLAQFLTVVVLMAAVVVAALMWNQRRPLRAVQLDGWDCVAQSYRDSVQSKLESAIAGDMELRLSHAEQIVESYPFVRYVNARRVGTTLLVSIDERKPIGLVRLADGTMLWLTSDSTTIPYAPYYACGAVPLIMAQNRARALEAVHVLRELVAHRKLSAACTGIRINGNGEIACRIEPWGITALLGTAEELSSKLWRLSWLIDSGILHSGTVYRIDLRWKNRIVYATAGVGQLPRRNRV